MTLHGKINFQCKPEPSAAIHPTGGDQQETPVLTEKNDERTSCEEESGLHFGSESDSDSHSGSDSWSESPTDPDIPLPYLRKITCLRVERVVVPNKTSLKEPDSNLP